MYDSIKAFSETDFTDDLKKFDIPTLVCTGGRPDRAGQEFGEEVSEADQGGSGNLLSGPVAWPHR